MPHYPVTREAVWLRMQRHFEYRHERDPSRIHREVYRVYLNPAETKYPLEACPLCGRKPQHLGWPHVAVDTRRAETPYRDRKSFAVCMQHFLPKATVQTTLTPFFESCTPCRSGEDLSCSLTMPKIQTWAAEAETPRYEVMNV